MLEKLFGSKSRVKILKTFLLNVDKKYYIRQVARESRLQVNSVRRELSNLEEFGLLSSSDNNSIKIDNLSNKSKSKKGKTTKDVGFKDKKYYWVNKNFILFSEIRSLMIKAQILAGESFIQRLKEISSPKFILLGGIFVNNDNSPTDVLIVADIDKEKLVEIISELESELGKEINFTVMDEKEFKYRQELADVFLHSILNSKRIVLLDKILDNHE
ncbi:MAG: hypothetical protein WC928_03885 [Patescibacteria group bacterium]|jgi:predicted transcriptional regulator